MGARIKYENTAYVGFVLAYRILFYIKLTLILFNYLISLRCSKWKVTNIYNPELNKE